MRGKITLAIADYVRSNPGSGNQAIFNALPDVKPQTINNLLGRLARGRILENRGGVNRFHPAEWYAVERPASDYAQELARDIYADMLKLPMVVREKVLAEKLDELIKAGELG